MAENPRMTTAGQSGGGESIALGNQNTMQRQMTMQAQVVPTPVIPKMQYITVQYSFVPKFLSFQG
jgi:hypothetical protein